MEEHLRVQEAAGDQKMKRLTRDGNLRQITKIHPSQHLNLKCIKLVPGHGT